MQKALALSLLFICFISNAANAEENTIFESVAKVNSGRSWGTATCINLDNDYIYLITNKHVVGQSSDVSVQFYRQGHESVGIPAQVIWFAYRPNEPVDIALVRVSRKNLSWTPKVISFELDDTPLKVNETCLTVGCPEAKWPRAYKGHIVNVSGGTYKITPTVEPGQSGSVLFNGDGTKAIGLIAWYEGNYGKAMTAETIQKAISGQSSNYYLKQPYNRLLGNEPTPIPINWEGCPNCRPGPNGPNGPFQNRPPREQNPNGPFNRKPNQPESPESPGDGIKIFPTYPGQPDDEFTPDNETPDPATPPQSDRFNIIEDRLTKLEGDYTALDTKVTDISTKLDSTTKKIDDLTIDFGYLKVKLPKKIEELEAMINNKPDKGDTVTPGKLDDFIKENTAKMAEQKQEIEGKIPSNEDINGVLQGVHKTLEANSVATKSEIKDLGSKVDQTIQNQSNSKDEIIKTLGNLFATAQKSEVNNTSVYHDISTTAVQTGIPAGALVLIGWWLKKILAKFAADYIKARLGGTATEAPFQQAVKIQ